MTGTASDTKPFRVLVVEDDVPLARALARQLRGRGYEVSVAHSAYQAGAYQAGAYQAGAYQAGTSRVPEEKSQTGALSNRPQSPCASHPREGSASHPREGSAARTGRSSLAQDNQRFDVGIFDIELPDAYGPAVARELLREGRVQHAVFYSSSLDESLRIQAEALGPLVDKLGDPSQIFRILLDIQRGERAALAAGAEDSTPNPAPNQEPPVSGRRVRKY